MFYIEVTSIESPSHKGDSTNINYLILNRACECAALIVNECLSERQANTLVAKMLSLNIHLDWILLIEQPKYPFVVELIQKKLGGIVAGNRFALSDLEDRKFFTNGQYEELSEYQVILLGHVELQVLPTSSNSSSCFQIENNLFVGDDSLLATNYDFKHQVFCANNSPAIN